MSAEGQAVDRRVTPGWVRGGMPISARHPASIWLRHAVPGSVGTAAICPRCSFEGQVPATLDHLLGDHASAFGEAAEWLETVDRDLFSLAVHYLMSQAGA